MLHFDTSDALEAGSATGFVFDAPEPAALAGALRRALALHGDAKRWRALQRAGMRRDFSWTASAAAYRRLYERLCR